MHEHRALRADQVQRLFFPSRNTANERLKRLYQHRFLERRWLAVEYGQGMGQAIYLLGRRGADLVAQHRGSEVVGWRQADNQVGSPFLHHHLMVNEVRIALALACQRHGVVLERWIGEEAFKAAPDHVMVKGANGRSQRAAILPDAYGLIQFSDRRAHFLLEVDRGTVSGRRWEQRVRAYLAYAQGGGYTRRFRTRSLRILTVTLGEKRLSNLKRATEEAGGGNIFWFTTDQHLRPEAILTQPVWQVAGRAGACGLITGEPRGAEMADCPQVRSAPVGNRQSGRFGL
ncbi:MAG: hypothetical protein GX597_26470 [Anaerolineaceae bacterium]|nr:hypothetical protein [Anaerolineaceae bacterium]